MPQANDKTKAGLTADSEIWIKKYVANDGTAVPDSYEFDAEDAGFDLLGYCTEEGHTLSLEKGDNTNIKGHNSDDVIDEDKPGRYKLEFGALEASRLTIGMYFDAEIDAAGKYAVSSPGQKSRYRIYKRSITNRGDKSWNYLPETKIDDQEGIQYADGEAKTFAFTLLTFREAELGKHLLGQEAELATDPVGPLAIVSGVTPSGAAATDTIYISGTRFTGATGVKIGGGNATSVTVVSKNLITCVVPAGSAGEAPIKVVNTHGESAPFDYTRGA